MRLQAQVPAQERAGVVQRERADIEPGEPVGRQRREPLRQGLVRLPSCVAPTGNRRDQPGGAGSRNRARGPKPRPATEHRRSRQQWGLGGGISQHMEGGERDSERIGRRRRRRHAGVPRQGPRAEGPAGRPMAPRAAARSRSPSAAKARPVSTSFGCAVTTRYRAFRQRRSRLTRAWSCRCPPGRRAEAAASRPRPPSRGTARSRRAPPDVPGRGRSMFGSLVRHFRRDAAHGRKRADREPRSRGKARRHGTWRRSG